MPPEARLKPIKVAARVLAGKAPWQINVPAALSETGKRQRLYRSSREEARAECERLEAIRDNQRVAVASGTTAQLLESAQCRELLAAHPGLSLRDVVTGYLKLHATRIASIPFADLYAKYLEAHQQRSPEHLYQMRWCLGKLEVLHSILASDLSTRMLEEALLPFTPSVRDRFRKFLHAVLHWGWERDYLPINPAAKLETQERERKEVEIFEPEMVAAILNDCLEHDLGLLPYRVFGFFCRVRPRGELPRLQWDCLDWQAHEKHLKLPAAITKKKRLRYIDVSPNAFAWLAEYRRRGGPLSGPVVPCTLHQLRKRHRANWGRVVGLTQADKPNQQWLKQGMRHSYCSYWLVANGNDTDTLVIQSGHEDKQVMWDSYYRATTGAKAKAFWSIRPPRTGHKVIPFAA